MKTEGNLRMTGTLTAKHIKANIAHKSRISALITRFRNAIHALQGAAVIYATLSAKHYISSESQWIDLGIICRRVVTTEFVNFLVDELQANQTRFNSFKHHGSGTSSVAEAVGDTVLGAETPETRAVGTQAEGASANIYRSVGTITYAAARAIVEHGLFSAASVPDELLDRSVFAVINVATNDKIEFTYELTCTAGG